MQKTRIVNPFAILKLEKRLKQEKGKQQLLQHFEQLRLEQRRLRNTVNVTITDK